MLRLHTLGRFDLLGGPSSCERSPAAQPKRLVLLTYIALATPPNGSVGRDRLLGLFWPDLDQAGACRALRQAVHYVRCELGCHALVRRPRERLGLEPGGLWCDAVEVARGGAVPEVLSLYEGEFLDGVHVAGAAAELSDWVEATRVALRERVARGWGLLADAHEAAGRPDEAIDAARRALALAPYDECGVRRLIRLLHQAGNEAGALAAYEQFARRIVVDFGVGPGPVTRALVETVRAGAAAAVLLA